MGRITPATSVLGSLRQEAHHEFSSRLSSDWEVTEATWTGPYEARFCPMITMSGPFNQSPGRRVWQLWGDSDFLDALLLFKGESLNNVCEQICMRVCACGGQNPSRVLLRCSLHCSGEAELDWQPTSPGDSPSLPPSCGYRHMEHACFLHGCWGFELKSSCLCSKYSYH